MTSEEILNAITKHNLTLRCFPTHEITYIDYRKGRELKEGETIVEVELQGGRMVKRIKQEIHRPPKWGVKLGCWPQWTKYDWYGETASEAVEKAVKDIEEIF